jgi:hypothetical protein
MADLAAFPPAKGAAFAGCLASVEMPRKFDGCRADAGNLAAETRPMLSSRRGEPMHMPKPIFRETARGAAIACVALLSCVAVHAQAYKAPRTAQGQPDLQGTWTNATLTPVERPAALGDKLVLSEAEATAMERQMAQRMRAADAPSDPSEIQRAGQAVGGYNMFWADFGTQVAIVNGERRSSLIVDPANGRVPPLQPQAERLVSSADRRGYDGPEQRPLGERCILAFGNASGPPALPVMYNSNYQIVQTANEVMILVEMPHDVRVIHLDGKPMPAGIRQWMGYSSGRWEGETLVVETSRFRPEQYISIGGGGTYRYVPVSENLKVVERFTRTGPRTIRYQFTVEDPQIFTQPWRGEVPLNAIDTPLYEYACHEGNYALPGILAGAREEERHGRQPRPTTERDGE